jgi:hypothetical protein
VWVPLFRERIPFNSRPVKGNTIAHYGILFEALTAWYMFPVRKKGMLSTKEFAQEVNAPYPTVMGWLREGRIRGAVFDDSLPRGGVWWIPRSAIASFKNPETRPRRGRPKKPGAMAGRRKPGRT